MSEISKKLKHEALRLHGLGDHDFAYLLEDARDELIGPGRHANQTLRAQQAEALESIRSRMQGPRVFIEGKQVIVIPIAEARAIVERKK